MDDRFDTLGDRDADARRYDFLVGRLNEAEDLLLIALEKLRRIEQWAFEFQDRGCVPCGRLIRETRPTIAGLEHFAEKQKKERAPNAKAG